MLLCLIACAVTAGAGLYAGNRLKALSVSAELTALETAAAQLESKAAAWVKAEIAKLRGRL
jgi:hypothetical protein